MGERVGFMAVMMLSLSLAAAVITGGISYGQLTQRVAILERDQVSLARTLEEMKEVMSELRYELRSLRAANAGRKP